jgi:hypothetical protein
MVVKLSDQQVRSWRLNKHHLLARADRKNLSDVVSQICGVQAQVMSGAELGIWARVGNVTADDVRDALWNERLLVKTWCMRGTLHLVAADDLPLYVAALKTRTVYRSNPWLKGQDVSLEEIDKITLEIRNALDGRRLTREELAEEIVKRAGFGPRLRRHLLSGWGSLLHPAAHQGSLCFGPNRGKNVTFVRPDQWIGGWNEPSGEEALRTLAKRFLAAYGPCSYDSFNRWWSILRKDAKKIFQLIIDELVEVEFNGRKAWLKKDDVDQVAGSKPAKSVRLLPSFDPYVMFYSPREHLVEDRFRTRVFRELAGWVSPVLLIDGAAAGVWKYEKKVGKLNVVVEPFRKLSRNEVDLVGDEGGKLGEFIGTRTDVEFAVNDELEPYFAHYSPQCAAPSDYPSKKRGDESPFTEH